MLDVRPNFQETTCENIDYIHETVISIDFEKKHWLCSRRKV